MMPCRGKYLNSAGPQETRNFALSCGTESILVSEIVYGLGMTHDCDGRRDGRTDRRTDIIIASLRCVSKNLSA